MSGAPIQPDEARKPRRIIRLEQTGSTNRYLKEHSSALPDRTVCYTDCQREGRGRLGRGWEVPPHTSLALSLLLFPRGVFRPLPLVCAVAASRAIEQAAGLPAYIKWPNDIVCSNRKVCGILCESGTQEGRPYAVAGLGINLTQTAQDMDRAGLPHAASLAMLTGKTVPVDDMAARLIAELDNALDTLVGEGLEALLPAYRRACITLGRPVRVLGQTEWCGRAVDVDAQGNLLVEADGVTRAVGSGEVSVRGLYGYV